MKANSFLVILFILASSHSYAGSFIAMPEVGTGQLDVDSPFAFEDGNYGGKDIFSLGFVGGYKFDSNIILAVNVSFSSTKLFWNVEDDYILTEKGLLIGYSFDIHRNFRIVPMLGSNYWDLSTEEDALFNSGREEELEFNGTDTYGRLNFEFPVTEVFQIVASYLYGDYDFGHYQTARVGFKFEF